jgi:acetolactate synthase small subunit
MTTLFFVDAENKPDVLARVAMVFHRRAIPIQTLVMVPGLHDNLRISLTAELDEDRSQRIVADLYKLVNVCLVETSHMGQLPEEVRLAAEHA